MKGQLNLNAVKTDWIAGLSEEEAEKYDAKVNWMYTTMM